MNATPIAGEDMVPSAARTSTRFLVTLLVVSFVASHSSCAKGDDSGPSLATRIEVTEHDELVCAPAPGSPPPDYSIVLDSVALPSSTTYPFALQTNRRDGIDGDPYYFAKTGLWWRGDAAFEIVVPDDFRDRLAISWGNADQPSNSSVSADCTATYDWAGAPGGFWVTEPMCADIIVRSEAGEQREQIGIGTPCPGQQPPQGHSDP